MRAIALFGLVLYGTAAAAGAKDQPRAADLATAIRGGDYAGVQRVLAQRSADPDRLLPDGSTALSWAAEVQDARMVRLLLGARAHANAASNAAVAPLMLACEHGDAAVLTLLLDAGADVKRSRDDGVTPLEVCAGRAATAIVARMIASGAAIDRADARGQTALMWAAANARLETFRLLLAHGAAVNRASTNGFTPLFFALKSGSPEMSATVLAAGGDPGHVGPEGTTAVQLAMYQKDYAFAARMIAAGADVAAFDRNGQTLLHAAVLARRADLVGALIAHGADVNLPSGTPKVQWRYEPNFKSDTYSVPLTPPLLFAARAGAIDIMQLLIAAGADTRVRMADGTNVLHAAVAGGHVAAVAKALSIAPDANAVDAKGRTPLHVLMQEGSDEAGNETLKILRLLAAAGAHTDIRSRAGKSVAELVPKASETFRTSYDAVFGARTAGL